VSGSDAAMKLLGVARATLWITFRPRFELCVPRFFFFDVRFVAKSFADYAERGGFGKAKFTLSGEYPRHFDEMQRATREQPLRPCFPASCRKLQAGNLCSGHRNR
jgi:hypothetical protein